MDAKGTALDRHFFREILASITFEDRLTLEQEEIEFRRKHPHQDKTSRVGRGVTHHRTAATNKNGAGDPAVTSVFDAIANRNSALHATPAPNLTPTMPTNNINNAGYAAAAPNASMAGPSTALDFSHGSPSFVSPPLLSATAGGGGLATPAPAVGLGDAKTAAEILQEEAEAAKKKASSSEPNAASRTIIRCMKLALNTSLEGGSSRGRQRDRRLVPDRDFDSKQRILFEYAADTKSTTVSASNRKRKYFRVKRLKEQVKQQVNCCSSKTTALDDKDRMDNSSDDTDDFDDDGYGDSSPTELPSVGEAPVHKYAKGSGGGGGGGGGASPSSLKSGGQGAAAASQPALVSSKDDDDDDESGNVSSFAFTSYSPICYQHIREFFGVNSDDFKAVLCNSGWHSIPTPGKSAAQLFFCGQNWVIKTTNDEESKFLRRILHRYYDHVRDNRNTLLPRFMGHYRLQVSGLATVSFVIMQNVFATPNKINEKFDLKGSTIGRFSSKEEKTQATRTKKDLDINRPINLGAARRELLIDQIKADCHFLKMSDIMDYSLLVGIHHIPEGTVIDESSLGWFPAAGGPAATAASSSAAANKSPPFGVVVGAGGPPPPPLSLFPASAIRGNTNGPLNPLDQLQQFTPPRGGAATEGSFNPNLTLGNASWRGVGSPPNASSFKNHHQHHQHHQHHASHHPHNTNNTVGSGSHLNANSSGGQTFSASGSPANTFTFPSKPIGNATDSTSFAYGRNAALNSDPSTPPSATTLTFPHQQQQQQFPPQPQPQSPRGLSSPTAAGGELPLPTYQPTFHHQRVVSASSLQNPPNNNLMNNYSTLHQSQGALSRSAAPAVGARGGAAVSVQQIIYTNNGQQQQIINDGPAGSGNGNVNTTNTFLPMPDTIVGDEVFGTIRGFDKRCFTAFQGGMLSDRPQKSVYDNAAATASKQKNSGSAGGNVSAGGGVGGRNGSGDYGLPPSSSVTDEASGPTSNVGTGAGSEMVVIPPPLLTDAGIEGILGSNSAAYSLPPEAGGGGGGGGGRREVYYIGIIDILQEYNARKLTETYLKSIIDERDKVSSVPAKEYAARFISFMSSVVV